MPGETTLSTAPVLAAYEAMAPWYDRLTFDHDFATWVGHLEPFLKDYGLEGLRLLDVACGTGKSFEEFARRGYAVTAVDLSPAMAARAALRDPPASVHVADMRELGVLGEFDLAICLGDALNYLDPPDIERTFAAIAANLRPGGVLMFDLNSLRTYRDTFGGDRCVDRGDGFIAWRGGTPGGPRPGGVAEATLVAFVPGGPGGALRRTDTHHRQRHHPEEVVRAALARTGYADVQAHGMRTDGAPDGPFDEWRHHKALFAASRPRAT